jgi:phosphate transport system substrate-binding protein
VGVLVLVGAAAAAILTTAVFAAKPKPLRGKISADGSSTVGPFAIAAAERFKKKNPGVNVTVGISGTGGGFERFCKGETDLSNASRPIRQATEVSVCTQNGVKYVAFTVANDGIALVVNRDATWVNCLTVDELKRIWNTGSNVNNWSQVRSGFPNVPLKLFGPGTDSGTFEFFTEKVNGRARASRADYTPTENDNVIVEGVSGERGGLGYFGLSYYEENKSRLKVLQVDGGGGCVTPTVNSVQRVQYKPLSRPVFIYAKRSSFRRPEVAAFIGFIFNNERAISTTAKMVPLTDRQLQKARFQYKQALKQAFAR